MNNRPNNVNNFNNSLSSTNLLFKQLQLGMKVLPTASDMPISEVSHLNVNIPLSKRYSREEALQKTVELNQKNENNKKRKLLQDKLTEQRIKEIDEEIRAKKKARTAKKPIPVQSLTNNTVFNHSAKTKPNSIEHLLTEPETPKIPEGANKTVSSSIKSLHR